VLTRATLKASPTTQHRGATSTNDVQAIFGEMLDGRQPFEYQTKVTIKGMAR
jgi:hypothetical protein